MGLFTRERFSEEDESSGIFISGLGGAITTWAAMQGRARITVAEAAGVFNTTPAIIVEAVDGEQFAMIIGESNDPSEQFIELDGE